MTTTPEDLYDDESDTFGEKYPTPLPQKGDVIFVKDKDDDERQFLHTHFREPQADGYKQAAEIIIDYIKKERLARVDWSGFDSTHWLIYPAYFAYRQSVEVSLKALLKVQKSEGRLPQNEEESITRTHDLVELWGILKPWITARLSKMDSATAAFEDLLMQIHSEDELVTPDALQCEG